MVGLDLFMIAAQIVVHASMIPLELRFMIRAMTLFFGVMILFLEVIIVATRLGNWTRVYIAHSSNRRCVLALQLQL